MGLNELISPKPPVKSRNQTIFEKFKSNGNLWRIPFKMMYNMSVLRHRFSNERGGGALNHLPLLFCKSVYFPQKSTYSLKIHILSRKVYVLSQNLYTLLKLHTLSKRSTYFLKICIHSRNLHTVTKSTYFPCFQNEAEIIKTDCT